MHVGSPSSPAAQHAEHFPLADVFYSGVPYRSPTASGSGLRRADQSKLFSSRRRFQMNVDEMSCQICVYVLNMHVKLLSSEAFLQPKMEQISFSGRAPPGPAGGAYRAYGSMLDFSRILDSLSSAHRMHDFTDFRRPNFTKFEHNTSIGVAMNPFGTEFSRKGSFFPKKCKK